MVFLKKHLKPAPFIQDEGSEGDDGRFLSFSKR